MKLLKLDNIRNTYKELKLYKVLIRNSIYTKILEIPIRNWNEKHKAQKTETNIY